MIMCKKQTKQTHTLNKKKSFKNIIKYRAKTGINYIQNMLFILDFGLKHDLDIFLLRFIQTWMSLQL